MLYVLAFKSLVILIKEKRTIDRQVTFCHDSARCIQEFLGLQADAEKTEKLSAESGPNYIRAIITLINGEGESERKELLLSLKLRLK